MRILFVDIDTLRPDHMGCYGYHRNTTPNIDRIAEEGLKFDNYYCTDAPCLPSRAALITGRYGIHNGVVGHGGTAADKRISGIDRGFKDADDENNFVGIFRNAGLYTASVSTFPERHSAWWFNANFNEMHNVGKAGLESGEEVLPVVLDWIDRNSSREDWFLHVHLWDPHTPYRAPASYKNPFENDPLPNWFTPETLNQHIQCVGPHSIRELNMYDDSESSEYPRNPGKADDFEGLRKIIDGYDCGVSYADFIIGRIFDALETKGLLKDTAVIVTSDHGENLGELGIYSEHGTADNATCRIPLIIKWPGVRAGVDSDLHCNIDLCPTMAEMLGTRKYDRWDGISFSQSVLNGVTCGRENLIISQMAHVCQRSVRFDKWLYMRSYHDGFHLFPKEMLFDLESDPHEQRNLTASHPELCAQAARLLMDWHDEMMASSESQIDPLWTVIHEGGPYHAKLDILEKYLKRLEATGRNEGAEKLREIYLKNRKDD